MHFWSGGRKDTRYNIVFYLLIFIDVDLNKEKMRERIRQKIFFINLPTIKNIVLLFNHWKEVRLVKSGFWSFPMKK